jgi:hypothetical protein
VLAILLIIAGLLCHDITIDTFECVLRNMIDRRGALSFRFILQPSMAAIVAVYDGLKDARHGRSPYLWTILRNPRKRIGRLREGLNATARIILLCVVMDAIYQVLELKTFHPNEVLIVALLLAFVPYLVIRGFVTRVAS